MKVYTDIKKLPKFNNAVVTIGSFDGVHLGHLQLIQKIKSIAQRIDGEDVVVTFHPHPRSIIFPNDNSLVLLNTLEEKLSQFEKANVSNVVIVPFTVDFSQQSPREYIENFIIKSFSPSHLIVGYDHRFGLNRHGDFSLLQQYEKEGHFSLIKIEKKEVESIAVSSTNIRNHLLKGNISSANSYLGYTYGLTGKVVHGKKIGNKIGFPTANIVVDSKHKLIPAPGIYAVKVTVKSIEHNGMLYIGNKPTISSDETSNVIEVNIFDFDQSIYGETISIQFIDFIRYDEKFGSLEKLSDQLALDKVSAIKLLANRSKKPINKLAIVVLNYNGKELLASYLPSLKTSSSSIHIDLIVIDNASTDDSVNYIKTHHPDVKIISLDKNYGFAGGYNKGLENVEHKYLALVNSDVLGTDGWLDPIINMLDKDPTIGCVQPKIKAVRDPESFEYAGAAGGFIDWLGYPFCRGRIFDTIENDKGQYDSNIEIGWASGAAFVIRNDIFKSLGGFDQSFFAHQEEIDLCLRINRAGYKCMYSNVSQIFHLGGATLAYESPRKTFLNFRNNLMTIVKNFPFYKSILVIPLRLILDGIAGVKFLFDGHPNNTLAIIRAHVAFYISIPRLLSKIKKEQKQIDLIRIDQPRANTIFSKSILFQYYLKRNKKYADL